MSDDTAATPVANASDEPKYHSSLERVHQQLRGLELLREQDPKPANKWEGFRRWKMRNLLGRWAAAQNAGRHDLAVTDITDGVERWVCTCGLLVPATSRDFDEATFLAAPGHRAMPKAPDWDSSLEDELVDEADNGSASTTTDDSNTSTMNTDTTGE